MKTVYDLIIEEKWLEAKDLAISKFENTKNTFELRNLIPVLLMLESYESVFNTVDKIWEYEGNKETDSEFQWLSIAHIFLNDIDKALPPLLEARSCKYTDEAGGVGLEAMIFAVSMLGSNKSVAEDSLRRIKKLLKVNRYGISCYTFIGKLILDDTDPEEFYSMLSTDESLRKSEMVRIYFYSGIKSFIEKDYKAMLYKLEQCEKYIPRAYFIHEYHMSRAVRKFLSYLVLTSS